MKQDFELDPELYGLVLERRLGHLRFPPLYALTIHERMQVARCWNRRGRAVVTGTWCGEERRQSA